MSTETLIKKYEIYISNVEWHINTNKPTGEGLRLSEQRLNDFKEILANLRSLESLPADTAEGLSAAWEYAKEHWRTFDSGDNDMQSLYEAFKEGNEYASQRQCSGSKGVDVKEIERRRDLIISEPEGIVRESMIYHIADGIAAPAVESKAVGITEGQISKILVDNKYRFPVSENDKAVFLVDIPVASKKIFELLSQSSTPSTSTPLKGDEDANNIISSLVSLLRESDAEWLSETKALLERAEKYLPSPSSPKQ